MKYKFLNVLIAVPLFLYPLSTLAEEIKQTVPKGWIKSGSKPSEYLVGIDKDNAHTNKSSMYIQGVQDSVKDFGTVMQSINAKNYLSKRVKFSAYLKSKDWKGWAGIWMRTDDINSKVLSFDNTENRAIKGTQDWTIQEIILDVPKESKNISFGVLVSGKGMVWADSIKLDIVNQDTPLTGKTF